jgi:hypothetical protein
VIERRAGFLKGRQVYYGGYRGRGIIAGQKDAAPLMFCDENGAVPTQNNNGVSVVKSLRKEVILWQ